MRRPQASQASQASRIDHGMSSPDLQRLLTAPILPTLLRLAAPNVLAMVMTVLVAGAGWWLAQHQGAAGDFYGLVAVTMLLYGVVTAAAVAFTPWGHGKPARPVEHCRT